MTMSGQAAAGWEPRYARRAQRMVASEIRELLKLLERPNIISFAGGIPDPALFPIAEMRAAYASVLSDPSQAGAGLQYSVSEGYAPLRHCLLDGQYRHHLWLAASLGVPGPSAALPG